jgi:ABC-type polysaccharide/polyol phosphate export permease
MVKSKPSFFHFVSLSFTLALFDTRGLYRRSIIGPFWLTISMGVTAATMGFVFGAIFGSPMELLLPSITAGLIFWGLISNCINEGCSCFIQSETIIKQLPVPYYVHLMRLCWRQLFIVGHNFLVLPLVLLFFGKSLSLLSVLLIPALILVMLCLSAIALALAIVCARYRDLTQIVVSIMQVSFYLTPIIWLPSMIPNRPGVNLLEINPFFHFLELLRGPLLGTVPNMSSWIIVILITIGCWVIAIFIFFRFRNRLAYWM